MHPTLYVNASPDRWRVRILDVCKIPLFTRCPAGDPICRGFLLVQLEADSLHDKHKKSLVLDPLESPQQWGAVLMEWLTGWRREKLLYAAETGCPWTAPVFRLADVGERLEQRIDLWNQANAV